MHVVDDRRQRRRDQRGPAGPRVRPCRGRHSGSGGCLPELFHLRHPLLRLRRGPPLAEPGPPHPRRPRSRRDAAAARHHCPADRRARPQAPGHHRRGRRGGARLRQARHRHRRRPGPPADHRPVRPGRPRRRRRGAPAALHGRHLRRHAHPRGSRTGQRSHRRRRVHRPGNGRRPDRPRPARHPDGTATRGAAHRRPAARRPRARRTRRPRRRGPDRHHRPGHQHRPARRTRTAAGAGRHGRRHGRDPPGRHGPGRGRGTARDRPSRRRRGHARRQGRDRRGPDDADRPAGHLRRRETA